MSALYDTLRAPLPNAEPELAKLRHFLTREAGIIRQALSYARWRHERKNYQRQLADIDAVLIVAGEREQRLAYVRRRGEEMDARRSAAPAPSPSSAPAVPGGLSWEAACHEVGHAVALMTFGGSVDRVELHADGGGRCVGTPPARVRDQLVCLAAGEESERAIGGVRCSQHDCSADRAEFQRVAQQLEPFERYDTMVQALGLSKEFVCDKADSIRRGAKALLQRGSMTGDELTKAVSQEAAPQHRPAPASAGATAAPTHRRRSFVASVTCAAGLFG